MVPIDQEFGVEIETDLLYQEAKITDPYIVLQTVRLFLIHMSEAFHAMFQKERCLDHPLEDIIVQP